MHVHLPKPLHGWRAFAGEVGVIVLGVLIALGAEQAVEALHWRSEVAQFRNALDKEVALDLAYYDYRLGQRECIHRRIADLERWQVLQKSGEAVALTHEIGRPAINIFGSSVWKSRSSELTEHIPVEIQLAYADMYDSLDGVNAQQVEERDAWRSLAAFNGANRLSADNLMRLSELIYRVKSLDQAIDGNKVGFDLDAAKIGVKPDFGIYRRFIVPPGTDFCKPLLADGGH